MPRFEYKVVPAPRRGLRAKGVKRAEDRFALAMSSTMNTLGAEGWEYVRSDILPTEERAGLASKQTVYHNLLIFRRELPEDAEQTAPPLLQKDEDPLALAAPDDGEDPDPWAEAPDDRPAEEPDEMDDDPDAPPRNDPVTAPGQT